MTEFADIFLKLVDLSVAGILLYPVIIYLVERLKKTEVRIDSVIESNTSIIKELVTEHKIEMKEMTEHHKDEIRQLTEKFDTRLEAQQEELSNTTDKFDRRLEQITYQFSTDLNRINAKLSNIEENTSKRN